MDEYWKVIDGYEGRYSVSNLGRVRGDNGILTNQIDKYGYVYTTFSSKGKSKKQKLHRLVAQAFIPNPENKPVVNHKNELPHDNNVRNLEWVTIAENNRYSKGVRTLLFYKGELLSFSSANQASIDLGLTLDNVYNLSRKTTYLLEVLNYVLTEGKSLTKVSLSNEEVDKGIGLKKGKFQVRVTHSGKRHYVGAYTTLEEARTAKIQYIDKYCPITIQTTKAPDLKSIEQLVNENYEQIK